MLELPLWSFVASCEFVSAGVLFSLHKSHICIDNVEVIIIIAMACHCFGLYLELTLNEGSLLRYHLKRGPSVYFKIS